LIYVYVQVNKMTGKEAQSVLANRDLRDTFGADWKEAPATGQILCRAGTEKKHER
jgi:hypothetical protein